jgi:hypothetical protein
VGRISSNATSLPPKFAGVTALQQLQSRDLADGFQGRSSGLLHDKPKVKLLVDITVSELSRLVAERPGCAEIALINSVLFIMLDLLRGKLVHRSFVSFFTTQWKHLGGGKKDLITLQWLRGHWSRTSFCSSTISAFKYRQTSIISDRTPYCGLDPITFANNLF